MLASQAKKHNIAVAPQPPPALPQSLPGQMFMPPRPPMMPGRFPMMPPVPMNARTFS
jgi:hypothetical protein